MKPYCKLYPEAANPNISSGRLEIYIKQWLINDSELAKVAPKYLTNELSYHPQSWNPLNRLTAAFAHASWDHDFFWFIVFIKRFSISAWFFVAFFVGWDIFYLFNDEGSSNINFAVHVGGAIVGYLLGLILFSRQKQEVGTYN
jgi:membrane associated rhomboid family serine protease